MATESRVEHRVKPALSPAGITLIYVIAASAWIFWSDLVLEYLVTDTVRLTHLQTSKGWFFVLATALLLLLLIKRHDAEMQRSEDIVRKSEAMQRELAETRRLLLDELDHRVKNNLAGLFALISLYARSYEKVPDFARAIQTRIMAMKNVHEMIAAANWHSVDLEHMVRNLARLLSPDDAHAFPLHVEGPTIQLSSDQAGPLAMIVQELLTNSQKYGALSSAEGRVTILWRIADGGAGKNRLHVDWKETGGPIAWSASKPPPRGMGLELIEGFTQFELGGTCRYAFGPQGFHCELNWPLAPVTARKTAA